MLNQIVTLIDGDPLPLIVAAALFTLVGRQAVANHISLRLWGWRIAFVVFVAYVVRAVALDGLADSNGLAAAGFRGLLAGGLMLGVAWIVLAIANFFYRSIPGFAARPSQRLESRRDQKRRETERQRTQEEQRQREQDRLAREREQTKQKETREQQQKQEQRRRQDSRFTCQVFYDRNATQLSESFSTDRLGEYFEKYLGDNHPADEVEQRADQLRAMLQEFLDQGGNGKPRFASIVEIREFYHQERLRIDESNMDDDLKGTLLSDLSREEELNIREFRQR